jgi:hypothetical protein
VAAALETFGLDGNTQSLVVLEVQAEVVLVEILRGHQVLSAEQELLEQMVLVVAAGLEHITRQTLQMVVQVL